MSARQELVERLRGRQAEIEAAVLTRVIALADPSEVRDPEYGLGLRAAVQAGISYGLSALEQGAEHPEPIPAELLSQARRAARSRVGLDTVLRRYVAAHMLLCDFIVQEAGVLGPGRRDLEQKALRTEAAVLDRLIDSVATEHGEALEAHVRSRRQLRAELVSRLLAGEMVEPGGLDYELSGWHVAMIAKGEEVGEPIRAVAASLGCRSLAIPRPEGVTWAWLGATRPLRRARIAQAVPSSLELAIGEPGRDLDGWRFSHLQACAASLVAKRREERITFYADVALLASALQDEVLSRSLEQLYLEPLARGRDGGETLRRTLCAYFQHERNLGSTAAALGVARQTVGNRLRTVEAQLGRTLGDSGSELELALRLVSLDRG